MAKRILLIDDDQAILRSLSFLLTKKGYEVAVAPTGAQGAEQFKLFAPDIVITDMIMPGHDGVETIRQIRQLSSDVKIIAMSGSSRGGATSFLEKALAAGADCCLDKPFERADLLDALAGLDES